MLGCAKPSDWLYHSSLVTDQDPQDIAKMCVWEKLLDHLREEIPYNLQLVKFQSGSLILNMLGCLGLREQ